MKEENEEEQQLRSRAVLLEESMLEVRILPDWRKSLMGRWK